MAIGRDSSYGCLRSMRVSDVNEMLDWMRDPSVAGVFSTDFASFSKVDVVSFVEESWSREDSFHFAISGSNEEYLGTVSLKNIDRENLNAEYAIIVKPEFQGTGVADAATRDVLKYAFYELGLHRVYLCVKVTNLKARRFYEKTGFIHEGVSREALLERGGGAVPGYRLVLNYPRGDCLVKASSRRLCFKAVA